LRIAAARRGAGGRWTRLLCLLPAWSVLFVWGLFGGRRAPREVHQAVVLREGDAFGGQVGEAVLLTLRPDLHGWELPGGAAVPGEGGEDAVRREVREETGLDVRVEARVGAYKREGFGAHVAHVYRCRVEGGSLRISAETPAVAWCDPAALPHTLFPWYRGPLADALARLPAPVEVRERQGLRAILAGMAIDLALRWRGVAVEMGSSRER
jgi:8-oxo-dGTP pyrophosphatase MutT (NUDIX family)